MITTTTNTIEGRPIREYFGLVTGEAIMGANVFRDFMAGLTDLVGGRSGTYESKFAEARETARITLSFRKWNPKTPTRRKGANAVVGIDIDYEVLGASNGMLMVTATGTAVKIG